LAAIGVAAVAGGRRVDLVQVRGRSMEPALLPGDRLIVEGFSYRRRAPRSGEIVLAPDPRHPERELVKRVGRVDASSHSAELLGDAPAASTDSRAFGPVELGDLRWRAALRVWPPGRIGTLR